jgi:transcription elongation GreA/GreB family factor
LQIRQPSATRPKEFLQLFDRLWSNLFDNTDREPDRLSVAFVKEESAEAAAETILPPRPISDRINLVTKSGLDMLHEALASAQRGVEEANQLEDVNERRRQSAVWLRDVRYYSERIRTAELIDKPAATDVVGFGHVVTFQRADGRKQTFRIVGEDEADPSRATLSHGSPVAIALMGKSVGDVVEMGPLELEILSITA